MSMNLRELRESLSFWRIALSLAALLFLLTANNFAHAQFVNTGNNPGNPNAPGYFDVWRPDVTYPPVGSTVDYTLPDGTPVGSVDFPSSSNIPGGAGGDASDSDRLAYSAAYSDEKVYGVMIGIGGWFAGLGGNAFEIAFENFVMRLGCYFTTGCNAADAMGTGTGAGETGRVGAVVNDLWTIIRDLINLAMIFSLIFIGFKLILDADDSGAKRALGSLIAAALLINFSLYIAKVVVDVSNFTAVEVYGALAASTDTSGSFDVVNTDPSTGTTTTIFSVGAGNRVAGSFMEVLLIPSWFQGGEQLAESWVYAIMAMIFLIFLGAIFLYGAFMMIARFIAIIVLLIFSPVMFIGWVYPGFRKYSSDWWRKFIGYCFYAPAYVFFLYLSLYTLVQLAPTSQADTAAGYAGAFSANGGFAANSMGIFLFFFVGAGLLLMSTKVAGMLASAGAGASMNLAGNWSKKLAYGAYGAGASALAWGAGSKLVNKAEEYEARTGRSTMLSRGATLAGNYARDKKIGGVNTRSAVKSTEKWFEDSVKQGDERAGKLKKTADRLTTLQGSDTAAIQKVFRDMSAADVVAMAKTKEGKAALKRNAAVLRPDQIKALKEDKELDGTDRKEILGAREAKLETDFAGDKLKGANDDQLASLGVEFLSKPENAINLSEAKIDKLPQLVAAEKAQLKTDRKNALKRVVLAGTPIGGVDTANLAKLKAEDLANLPDDVFNPGATLDGVSAADIQSRVENFVNQISLSKMATLQSKKDDVVIQNIRSILAQNPDPDVVDWLANDRVGRRFGTR